MRQIVITGKIKKAAKKYSDSLFKDKISGFVHPKTGLENLIIDLKEVNGDLADCKKYIAYVDQLVRDYDELITLLPSKFNEFKGKYDEILPDTKLSVCIKHRKRDLPENKEERSSLSVNTMVFYKEIVERMNYKESRLYLAPCMEEIGINTCVYCNIIPAFSSQERKEAYFPFDHYMPKSKYPFLCLCFYNLNPICYTCNGHKSDDEKKGHQLYVESEPAKDPFVFEIDRKSIEEGNPQSIRVCFNARESKDVSLRNKYEYWYRIEEYYNASSEKRSHYKMIKDIYNFGASYFDATNASIPNVIDRAKLFQDVLGIEDGECNIFTDVKKKLKIDTAKDAGLI